MALEQHFTAADMWFIGEDKIIEFAVYQLDGVTPQDITGWDADLRWDIRKTDKAGDPPIITKTTATGLSVVGVYNVVPASNTQRVRITVFDEDTNALKPLTYRHALKRLTAGGESILTFGNLVLRQAAVR